MGIPSSAASIPCRGAFFTARRTRSAQRAGAPGFAQRLRRVCSPPTACPDGVFPLAGCRKSKHQVPRVANRMDSRPRRTPFQLAVWIVLCEPRSRRAGGRQPPEHVEPSRVRCSPGADALRLAWRLPGVGSPGLKTVAASRKPTRLLVAVRSSALRRSSGTGRLKAELRTATAGISREPWRDSGLEIVIQESSAVAHPASDFSRRRNKRGAGFTYGNASTLRGTPTDYVLAATGRRHLGTSKSDSAGRTQSCYELYERGTCSRAVISLSQARPRCRKVSSTSRC